MKILLLGVLIGLPAFPQSITGAISGVVIDPSDAVMTGVSIRLTNSATGAERSAVTNETGRFFFGSLQPGAYKLAIEAAGFKRLEQSQINVPANETVSLPEVKLEVGQTTESVEVRAHSAIVQTATGERAGVVTSSQVQNLSIRGRNITSLVSLLPGVVDLDDQENLAINWNFNVQGNRRNTNNLMIDGATVNAIGNQFNSVVSVSMDAVAEVKVLLTNFQAEYGRLAGANVQVVTKSGGREFHGLASYFKRNEVLNANDFFNNRLGRLRPRYRFDTWNYQIGGPVYIPGKFNRNKDKLFFFWSQEYWPLSTPVDLTPPTTPTELERAGNFSQSVDVNNAAIIVRDPANACAPFPGNIIPANRIDPSGQALLRFLPLPNFTNRAISLGNYNYVFQSTLDQPKRTDTGKLDYNINSSNLLMFSYSRRDDNQEGPFGSQASPGNYDIVRARSENQGKLFLMRYQKIFSPSLINEFNGSYSTRPLNSTFRDEDLKKVQRDTIGFRAGQLHPETNPLHIIPNASFAGVTNPIAITFDSRTPLTTTHEILTFSDNLTKSFASHTIKLGFYFDRLWAANQTTGGTFNGAFNFDRNVNNPLETDYAFSNAILGVFNQYDEPTGRPFPVNYASNTEWFAQDTWKVIRRFSLDFGLRFTYMPQSWINGEALSGFELI